MISGILPINKPIDIRSTYCVDQIRRAVGRKNKVGHGGTLDSTASGLLVILLGHATRLSSFVMEMPKCYDTVIQLGSETSTDDASGEITKDASWKHVSENSIDTAMCGFLGWRMQSPPNISAVHIDGERAHVLARSGQNFDIASKAVYFEKIIRTSPISWDGKVSFRVYCRKGTYIRSFARDFGRALSSCAHVSSLERFAVGNFSLEQCRKAQDILNMNTDEILREIIPIQDVRLECPSYRADAKNETRLINGLGVNIAELKRDFFPKRASENGNIAVVSEKLFSVCSAKMTEGTFSLMPSVNIINDRS